MQPCRWRSSSEISWAGKSSLISSPLRYRRVRMALVAASFRRADVLEPVSLSVRRVMPTVSCSGIHDASAPTGRLPTLASGSYGERSATSPSSIWMSICRSISTSWNSTSPTTTTSRSCAGRTADSSTPGGRAIRIGSECPDPSTKSSSASSRSSCSSCRTGSKTPASASSSSSKVATPPARAGRSSGSLEHLNPRGAQVVALEKPSERERGEWYFQRYVEHLPSAGEMVLFDRSWYNRAGVERVDGLLQRRPVPHLCRAGTRVRGAADGRRDRH